jgi:acyl carrier protein
MATDFAAIFVRERRHQFAACSMQCSNYHFRVLMDVRSAVRNFLKNTAPKGVSFTDADNLLVKGVIDSLRMLDLINFLEEKFRLKVDEDELMPENFESVDAITRFVEQRINA